MTGVEPWNVPRSGSVQATPKHTVYEGIVYIQDVFDGGADRAGVEVPRFHPQRRTEHFTANTCSKCSVVILAGTTYGLHLNLEPRTLDDHTEYLALADNVRTYNLHPDLTARRRHLEHIIRPERHPRHAEHVCGQQYGRNPRPAPSVPAVVHDDPPF